MHACGGGGAGRMREGTGVSRRPRMRADRGKSHVPDLCRGEQQPVAFHPRERQHGDGGRPEGRAGRYAGVGLLGRTDECDGREQDRAHRDRDGERRGVRTGAEALRGAGFYRSVGHEGRVARCELLRSRRGLRHRAERPRYGMVSARAQQSTAAAFRRTPYRTRPAPARKCPHEGLRSRR